jgi:hypothetical protein
LSEDYTKGEELPILPIGYNQEEELLQSSINMMNSEPLSPPQTPVDTGSPMSVDTTNESIPEGQGSDKDEDACGCPHDGSSHNTNCDHSEIKALELQDHNESVCCICGVEGANCSCAKANCVCEMHEDCLDNHNNSGVQATESNSQNQNQNNN